LPIFGEFTKKVNVSRFAKLFYTMNKTGINITKTFQIMQETMENSVYNKELEIVAEKIIKGQEIAVSLQQSKYFTPLICEMVSIGEKSGALDEMLFNVSEYYSREVSDTVDNMTALIEPILTIVMGGMVLLLALSMLMPMLDMMNIL
jgi:type II secretory pathway component PulF